jgi:hypothetical protein
MAAKVVLFVAAFSCVALMAESVCPPTVCNQQCVNGDIYQTSIDSNGCLICTCEPNLCGPMKCTFPNTLCKIRPVRSCTSGSCSKEAVCVNPYCPNRIYPDGCAIPTCAVNYILMSPQCLCPYCAISPCQSYNKCLSNQVCEAYQVSCSLRTCTYNARCVPNTGSFV